MRRTVRYSALPGRRLDALRDVDLVGRRTVVADIADLGRSAFPFGYLCHFLDHLRASREQCNRIDGVDTVVGGLVQLWAKALPLGPSERPTEARVPGFGFAG